MHYLNISFSHKNSSIEIREKLSYPHDNDMHGCLKKLNSSDVYTVRFQPDNSFLAVGRANGMVTIVNHKEYT